MSSSSFKIDLTFIYLGIVRCAPNTLKRKWCEGLMWDLDQFSRDGLLVVWFLTSVDIQVTDARFANVTGDWHGTATELLSRMTL